MSGKDKVDMAKENMKILDIIGKEYERTKPFDGFRIGMCMHITKETAVLAITLKRGGAEVMLTASNPSSTQDDVAEYLNSIGIKTLGRKDESEEEYWRNIASVGEWEPNIIVDDGGDLTTWINKNKPELAEKIIGGCEETTTGVIRMRKMEREGKLKYPVIAVNNNYTKRLVDNYYGTGQSTIDGILRATNTLIAGKTVVVSGYGPCGKGVSLRAKGLGAKVIVCEVDPVRALQAYLDGYRVMKIENAAKEGDLFITVTGDINVIKYEHIKLMKSGAILANSGHFDVEIDVKTLKQRAKSIKKVRPYLDKIELENGKHVYLCADGRLVNLVAAEGHPSEIMATSFAGQCKAIEYLLKNRDLPNKVIELPYSLDQEIADLQLKAFGAEIDRLDEEQKNYLGIT